MALVFPEKFVTEQKGPNKLVGEDLSRNFNCLGNASSRKRRRPRLDGCSCRSVRPTSPPKFERSTNKFLVRKSPSPRSPIRRRKRRVATCLVVRFWNYFLNFRYLKLFLDSSDSSSDTDSGSSSGESSSDSEDEEVKRPVPNGPSTQKVCRGV